MNSNKVRIVSKAEEFTNNLEKT